MASKLSPYLQCSRETALPFDRTLGSGREAILYADPTSDSFGEFHRALCKAARAMRLNYRLRYRPDKTSAVQPLPVSGFGVELALKRTDYIVIDDREDASDSVQQPLGSGDILDGQEEVADLKPLSSSELASLGLKAASFIQKSDSPFETLVRLTQDFPRFSAFIATHSVSETFSNAREQSLANAAHGGANFLWMNGVQLIDRQIEPFALLEMLRRERKLINSVRDLGLSGKQAVSLLGHSTISTAKGEEESPRYDWTDRLEDGRVIVWLNDLETESRYDDYPKTLISVCSRPVRVSSTTDPPQLLQRTFPGQMPPIGLNVFNLVVPVDLSNSDDVKVVNQIASIMSRGIPIRFGLVPLTSTAEATAQAKVMYHLLENHGVQALLAYTERSERDTQTAVDERHFAKVAAAGDPLPGSQRMSLSEVLEAETFEKQIELARHWAERLKVDTATRSLLINGVIIARDQNWMQTMSVKIGEDLQTIQKGIFQGALDEGTWIPGIFLEGAATRRNVYIALDNEKTLRMLDVSRLYTEHATLFGTIPVLESYAESTKENWATANIVADMTTQDGLKLVLAALEFKRNNPGVRLELIHNPENSSSASQMNWALKSNEGILKDIETIDELSALPKATESAAADDNYALGLSAFLKMGKIEPGKKVIILNGRVIGPISAGDPFTADDFQQLLEFEQKRRILPVYAAFDDLGLSDKLSSAVTAAKATSIIALSMNSDLPEGIFETAPAVRSTLYDSWNSSHAAIEIGDSEKASIHITGLLDPVSEKGQRWAPILKVLSELNGVYLKLILNPHEKIAELPLKRFFRYVMDSKPSFDERGKVRALKATFGGLPSEALLTVGMDVPPAWLVAPKESVHDLDNIKLSSVRSDVDATYELEHILIEGHSREGRGKPPRGAQLVLATERNPMVTDTVVMANLGFFQFKANPGFYNIRLKEGRTAEIYAIESIGAQGYEAAPDDEGTELALMDFQGTTLYPRLKRRPGMEQQDVLETADGSSASSIVSKGIKFAEELFGGSKSKSVSAQEINIFSVASGHLYERMLNIMMVSTMRNTKHSVKFWFIEQFLSPSFKEFIPFLAKEYGFKYEMVTYKWPHWLRQQKEKQREIWGYKILFLDVLFPLSLDKVIFVDADQVVRTDMMDLVNLDLNGAPYGFTPMCDSRTEMEGFRFWKQGYWATYLRGRPYHISALYVVDLRRFRELAAGDRLRQQYHALSTDPGSLSNLDQDLPNHMQFEIPIHSLPQEWLWCETWCSDESLAQARTIDLCNNPQTKEPKLDRARRQVPEWTVYDDEIAEVVKKWRQGPRGNERPGDTTPIDKGVRQPGAIGEEKQREVNIKSRKWDKGEVHSKDEL